MKLRMLARLRGRRGPSLGMVSNRHDDLVKLIVMMMFKMLDEYTLKTARHLKGLQ